MQVSEFKLSLLYASSGRAVLSTPNRDQTHKFGLTLMAYGFLKCDCVIMQKKYCFTCTRCVHSILYLPFSFIRQLILADSPLSVI